MRHLLLKASGLLFAILMYGISCSGSDEPKSVDCTLSDLVITAVGQNPTNCSVNDGTITALAAEGDQPYTIAIITGSFHYVNLGQPKGWRLHQ